MAFTSTEPQVIVQPIATTSTTQLHPLGTIVRAVDSTYGVGEFIYLRGVGSTVVGSIVEYDTSFQTGLSTIAVTIPTPLAVAMSINIAANWGWYQISGESIMVLATSVTLSAGVPIGTTSGEGVLVVTGLLMANALVAVNTVNGTASARVMINRPAGPTDTVQA